MGTNQRANNVAINVYMKPYARFKQMTVQCGRWSTSVISGRIACNRDDCIRHNTPWGRIACTQFQVSVCPVKTFNLEEVLTTQIRDRSSHLSPLQVSGQ